VAWKPTLLEDSLDPWLAIEPDVKRRRAVIEFLMDLCQQGGTWDGARPIAGTKMPAFAAGVPDQGVVVVWVVATSFEQLAIRYVYDIRRDVRFGG